MYIVRMQNHRFLRRISDYNDKTHIGNNEGSVSSSCNCTYAIALGRVLLGRAGTCGDDGIGVSLKGVAKLSSGIVGSLSAQSTCRMPPCVAGVAGGVSLLSGGSSHGESNTLHFLLALVSSGIDFCCCRP